VKTMTRKKAKAGDNRKRLWLLPLLLVVPAAALAWKEFPALARYVKIARM
jgi:hypothetical protein